ncbi:BA75_02789T0 [Komagataella pastoris]|uniref:Probable 26S proteasome regulatory subunit p27 n=1 Tax=Komagataella pastoris TaxID=4922 RepID=A0A1B2JC88_PICPA|nr:BA75_02789T0 [Komagataella pastoris]
MTSNYDINSLTLGVPDYDITDVSTFDLTRLGDLKKIIESSLTHLFDTLKDQNVDMNTSLLTQDGFPRDDIDIVRVRLARTNIVRLRNDHKKVLEALDVRLQEHYSSKTKSDSALKDQRNVAESAIPFARITEVVKDSPADKAGLQSDDLIVVLGKLTTNGANLLQNISRIVLENENKPIELTAKRNGDLLQLTLTPKKWEGRGLLGCRLDLL